MDFQDSKNSKQPTNQPLVWKLYWRCACDVVDKMLGMKGWGMVQLFQGVSFALWESKLFQKWCQDVWIPIHFFQRERQLSRHWVMALKKVSTILTTNRATTHEEIPPPPHQKKMDDIGFGYGRTMECHEDFLIARVAAGMLKREATSWQHQALGGCFQDFINALVEIHWMLEPRKFILKVRSEEMNPGTSRNI